MHLASRPRRPRSPDRLRPSRYGSPPPRECSMVPREAAAGGCRRRPAGPERSVMIKIKTFATPIKSSPPARAAGTRRAGDRLPCRAKARQGLLAQRHHDGRRERRDHRPHPDRRVPGARLTAAHDIAIVREALRLERQAEARYTEHPAASSDPRLVAYLESLRRNEAEHRALLEAWLRDHDEDQQRLGRAGAGAKPSPQPSWSPAPTACTR